MKSVRICIQNIRKWTSNSRVMMIFIFAALSVSLYTSGLMEVGREVGLKSAPWLFPFLFTHRYMKITLMIPCVFLFSDAPFIDANQLYCIIRTGRRQWCVGQILYIFVSSAFYTVLLMSCSIIFNMGNIYFDSGWGELLGSAGTTSLMNVYNHQYDTVRISNTIIRYYTPVQAMLWSAVLVWLSLVFLGMLMYVINSLSGNSTAGCLVDIFLVTFTSIVDAYPYLNRYSPISWNSLNNIDIANTTEYPGIDYILSGYGGSIILLCIIAVIISRKQQMTAHNER